MADVQHFQDLVLDAVEVVQFKLIRSRADLENDSLSFHPSMAHQIFGESESIFGFQNLRVRILYTAGSMHIYLDIDYAAKVDDISHGEIKADNVVATITEKMPDGCYFVNMDDFLKTLDKADKFQPYGEKLTEYVCRDVNDRERLFEFYHCDHKISAFLKFFSRLQSFILWFVDAASYIDVDDPQWIYFVCFEKYKNNDGNYQFATIGYTTVYEYYAYPQHKRPRISQMLVLPPYQKMGVGARFLETIYAYYQGQNDVIDITVEDPADDFKRLRNFVDVRLCLGLKSFAEEEVKKGFNNEMVREARGTLKLNPRQCRLVYEIIRLYYTNVNDEQDYTAYRLVVKKRLNASYFKQMGDIKKMEKAKIDTEWLRAQIPPLEQRLKQLHEEYKEVENEYKRIINKLRTT